MCIRDRGNTALLNQLDELPALTVVGTRSANGYGKKVAHSFSYDLARAGFVILSGLAQGIDSCALEGALEAGGKTVTVLPTGLDYTSPAQSEPLRRRILENSGVVLSELSLIHIFFTGTSADSAADRPHRFVGRGTGDEVRTDPQGKSAVAHPVCAGVRSRCV